MEVKGNKIIISDNTNEYHVRASNRYVGVQVPNNNEKVMEVAKAFGGAWKPGARVWAVTWDKAQKIVEALAELQVPGYTLTIDEDVAYEIGLID